MRHLCSSTDETLLVMFDLSCRRRNPTTAAPLGSCSSPATTAAAAHCYHQHQQGCCIPHHHHHPGGWPLPTTLPAAAPLLHLSAQPCHPLHHHHRQHQCQAAGWQSHSHLGKSAPQLHSNQEGQVSALGVVTTLLSSKASTGSHGSRGQAQPDTAAQAACMVDWTHVQRQAGAPNCRAPPTACRVPPQAGSWCHPPPHSPGLC